jgi:hypothetical protein
MDRHPDDLADVPTAEEYKKAFLACKAALKSKAGDSTVLEMLRINYEAPDRTITATELAKAANLGSYSAANLKYGNYAKEICEYFGLKLKSKSHIAVLVRFSGGTPGSADVRWTMHPQVATALEELGWVNPRT